MANQPIFLSERNSWLLLSVSPFFSSFSFPLISTLHGLIGAYLRDWEEVGQNFLKQVLFMRSLN